MAPDAPAQQPLGAIDFEATDFDAARAALEEPPAGVKALKRLDRAEWVKRRRPPEARDRLLTPRADAWLEHLPRDLRPLDLPRAYPRIVNQLAEVWNDADACLSLLADLVVDQRGGRKGFPGRVALEVVALREHRTAIEQARR